MQNVIINFRQGRVLDVDPPNASTNIVVLEYDDTENYQDDMLFCDPEGKRYARQVFEHYEDEKTEVAIAVRHGVVRVPPNVPWRWVVREFFDPPMSTADPYATYVDYQPLYDFK